MEYHVFISHASEDKDDFVRPLAKSLQHKGLTVWYDEFSLNLGDSITESINYGLANSAYGIVVISSHFLSKKWTQRELNALFATEGANENKILPIWYKIEFDEIRQRSPLLADISAIKASSAEDVKKVVASILKVVNPKILQQELTKQKDIANRRLAELSASIGMYLTINMKEASDDADSFRKIIDNVQKATAILTKALDEIATTGEVSQVLLKLVVAEKLIKETLAMYCIKCRAKRNVEKFETLTMKNGGTAIKAVCPICGTLMFKIGTFDT